ncbi:adenylyltransferase/cytidyltransferase family protein [Actinomadura atramentaria]|uniref:adenylyltransferase/cytidyltransferase family protein n=1 Tax=Actinomadura atramentaria TaxID=1990 RepID=UPI000687FA86|nr:adenylyltransferase/cytidyltransferase family protein [Actinomadura atramentaria]
MQGVIGFSFGSFDLFHVGHLDLLRRAAARCDRLVVGVLDDRLAAGRRGSAPIVPLIERLEIVAEVACVAEAVALADADLLAAHAAVGFHAVFAGGPDAPVSAAAERALSAAGVRVVRFDDLAATASPVLRSALDGGVGAGEGRSSVA